MKKKTTSTMKQKLGANNVMWEHLMKERRNNAKKKNNNKKEVDSK